MIQLVDGFITFEIPEWPLPEPRSAVRFEWRAGPRVMKSPVGPEQGVSVFVGPLLLTPDLAEKRTVVERYAFESADWDITATAPWAYAVPQARWALFGPVERQQP